MFNPDLTHVLSFFTNGKRSFVEALSDDILILIFSRMRKWDLRKVVLTCKKWRSVILRDERLRNYVEFPVIIDYIKLMDDKQRQQSVEVDKKTEKKIIKFLPLMEKCVYKNKKVSHTFPLTYTFVTIGERRGTVIL